MRERMKQKQVKQESSADSDTRLAPFASPEPKVSEMTEKTENTPSVDAFPDDDADSEGPDKILHVLQHCHFRCIVVASELSTARSPGLLFSSRWLGNKVADVLSIMKNVKKTRDQKVKCIDTPLRSRSPLDIANTLLLCF